MRQPVVSGSFYDSDKSLLTKQIDECFSSPFGPGDEAKTKKETSIKGVIVPHAGYYFSGACAAHAYRLISMSAKKRFIFLGVNHHGYETGVSAQDWITPLGIAKYDKKIVQEFSDAGIKLSETPHIREHSLEVQIPFLQRIKEDFTFAAVGVGHDADMLKLAETIAKFEDAIVIASSDFTHYGFSYGFVPFSTRIRENLETLDMGAINLINTLDSDGFKRYVNKTGMTICGYLPILVLLACMKNKGVLLKYYTSGDVIGDYSSSVSYASIAFE